MKAKRQMKIIEIVSNNVVSSQEELCRLLAEEGIKVTQATISRDIKEMHLARVPSGDGRYRYSVMPGNYTSVYKERFNRLFKDCCVSMEKSGNVIIVKSISGTGPAVGEAIDGMNLEEIAGSVAGDNSVILVVREGYDPSEVLETLRTIAGM